MKPQYIANSFTCASYISQRHNLKIDSVKIINNAIDPNKIKFNKSYWKSKFNLIGSETIAIMVANFYPEKRHDILLKAWSKLCLSYSNKTLKLILVGYSPTEIGLMSIKSLAFDLNLYNNIIFIESCDDISGLCNICDVGILTSESEGCSNSILEYMYHGVIPVASDISANTEILSKNYPFLFNLNNIEDLVLKLSKIIDYEKTKIIDSNKKILNRKYSLKNLKKKYIELI